MPKEILLCTDGEVFVVIALRTVFPIGVTIYDPERCFNGYNLFPLSGIEEPKVLLVDMNGNLVHEWQVHTERAKLLRDGKLLLLRRGRVQELAWHGDLVWEFKPPYGGAHHDVERLENGNTLVLSREPVPDEYRARITDPVRKSVTRLDCDHIIEVTPEKKVVWDWHSYEHLDINEYCEICSSGDWTHMNTIRALPTNRHHEKGDGRFKPRNVLMSPRNLSFIFIVDRDTGDIVWKYQGNYRGGLGGQHEPHMIEEGLPGEGNILIFDNGAPPTRSLAHTGRSFILEVDPVTEELVWKYEDAYGDRGKFYSSFRSTVQRLPNGNTFICEYGTPRLFEVTRERETVWEYTREQNTYINRAMRYSYQYCPQLAALGKPEEKKVVPPAHTITYARVTPATA